MKSGLIAGAAVIVVAGFAPLAGAAIVAYDGLDTSNSNGTPLTSATDTDTTGWATRWWGGSGSGTLTTGLTYSQTSPVTDVIHPTRMILMAEQPVNNYLLQSWHSYTIGNNLLIIHYIIPNLKYGQWNVLFSDYHVAAPMLNGDTGQSDTNANAPQVQSENGSTWDTNVERNDYSLING